jgi:hypothetical protein
MDDPIFNEDYYIIDDNADNLNLFKTDDYDYLDSNDDYDALNLNL